MDAVVHYFDEHGALRSAYYVGPGRKEPWLIVKHKDGTKRTVKQIRNIENEDSRGN